ncbi:Peptidyl-prolyl cis-trans isomerase [Durusdinium trenchii]|uniref:Chloroplastic (PPIase) (Cyclophilin) (Cyclosporin A-binding protein) (CYP B) (Rotamase) n=1 Tax=Durusdinium trenchii TaxID=1381693 RepID=A0ABP0PI16_9DINO
METWVGETGEFDTSASVAHVPTCRHVVFGTVLEGMKFVRQIEGQNGTPPKEECKIEDSGELPLEKPYKDGQTSRPLLALLLIDLLGTFQDATYRGKLDEEL